MRRIVGSAGILAYTAVACLIVAALGRTHRDGLKPLAFELKSARSETPSSTRLSPDGSTPLATLPPQPEPSPAPASGEGEPSSPSPPVPDPTQNLESIMEASAEPATVPQFHAEQIHPIFARPEAKRKWDLERLTPSDEMEMGRSLHEMILLSGLTRRVQNEVMERRLLEAAAPIVEACRRRNVQYTYYVLDSDEVNAFSHPGGYIYVTRGLMDWLSEDQDAALQFVLAHEIHHVDEGDAIRCLRDPTLVAAPMGTLEAYFAIVLPRGHGRKLELAADDWALQQLRRLQRTRRECLSFLAKLDRYAGAHGFLQGDSDPRRELDVSLFDFRYRALPGASFRLTRLKSRLDQPSPASIESPSVVP